MRILLVSYGYTEKDLSRHSDVNSEALSTFYLSNALRKHHDISIITKDASSRDDVISVPCHRILERIEEKITGRGVGQLKLDYPEFIYKAKRIARSRLDAFDIVHQISPKSFRYPSPMASLERPFVLGPIGGSIPYPPGFESIEKRENLLVRLRKTDRLRLEWDPMLSSTMTKAVRILVTSRAALGILPERYRAKAVVVPQGIYLDTDAGAPGTGAASETPYIFSSGRLVPYKGMDLVVRAFARLKTERPLQLLITGDGPERSRLEQMIGDLDVKDRVRLLGKIPKEENLALMKNARFCVFGAINEAFGAVNLEAMAAQKAIIVTDWGGPADVVEPGETGFKVLGQGPEQYVEHLVEPMQRLAVDAGLCRRLGENALNRVRREFTWDAIGSKISDVYSDIENSNRAGIPLT